MRASKHLAGPALGLAAATAGLVQTGLAQTSLAQTGFAQTGLAQSGEPRMSPAREKALRECNAQVKGMSQYTWGVQQLQVYRACMGMHGMEKE